MHEFWTISTANMAYTRSQTYTNMLVGEHGIQAFEDEVVMLLSIDVFVPTSAHPLLILDKWFVQIYLNGSCSWPYREGPTIQMCSPPMCQQFFFMDIS